MKNEWLISGLITILLVPFFTTTAGAYWSLQDTSQIEQCLINSVQPTQIEHTTTQDLILTGTGLNQVGNPVLSLSITSVELGGGDYQDYIIDQSGESITINSFNPNSFFGGTDLTQYLASITIICGTNQDSIDIAVENGQYSIWSSLISQIGNIFSNIFGYISDIIVFIGQFLIILLTMLVSLFLVLINVLLDFIKILQEIVTLLIGSCSNTEYLFPQWIRILGGILLPFYLIYNYLKNNT